MSPWGDSLLKKLQMAGALQFSSCSSLGVPGSKLEQSVSEGVRTQLEHPAKKPIMPRLMADYRATEGEGFQKGKRYYFG